MQQLRLAAKKAPMLFIQPLFWFFHLKVLREQQAIRAEREAQRIRMMNADPFDLEAQRLIAQVSLTFLWVDLDTQVCHLYL